HASMLPYILLLACLLLSGQAQSCSVSEIIRHTTYLLESSPASCPCRERAVGSCSCLPIAEPGYEVACFVEGTTHMLENNVSSKQAVTRLKRIFQTQLDRKLCESLTRGNQCQYKTKGNVEEFLNKILRTYQAINK
ncbi:Interleukin-9, partial [Egretta garzetta]